ncbi:MAG: hypothetical protein M3P08_09085 [Thermoproteota archaeon]|nr:hypothetical protein [Thermoproteota archaeon]
MQELDFFHEICLTALFSSLAVKFAAVLDINGKLIVSEYRRGIQSSSRANFTPDRNYYHASYPFYLDYLVPATLKRRFCYLGYAEEELHFEITEIGDNVRLAVTPLTENKDKYLCIYLESSARYEDVISKLNNAII